MLTAALASDVKIVATAAVSGDNVPAAASAAAVAVVLALLTMPPAMLTARNPRFPRNRCATVPAQESARKITPNFSLTFALSTADPHYFMPIAENRV